MSKVSDAQVEAALATWPKPWEPYNLGVNMRKSLEAAEAAGQHTDCAVCHEDKPTPLRIEQLGGYVCLTCIDRKLTAALEAVSSIHEAEPVKPFYATAHLTLDGFAEWLTAAMDERGATVRRLAETLGIDKSAISRARTGKGIEARHFIQLWNWLAHPNPISKGVTVKALESPGWMPINSAPKNGTELLLWCGQPVCGHFSGDDLDPERTSEGWITDISWTDITEPTHWCAIPAFNEAADRIIREYGRDTPVDDLALVLFEAWCSADPSSGPAKYPASYLATFADMARAAIAWGLSHTAGEIK